jgi:transcriptional regulator with XRE-family HTH domain
MPVRTEFGKAIAKLRIEKDCTAKEMAAKLDCSVAYLNGIEYGRTFPSIQFMENLRKAYDMNTGPFQYLVLAGKKSGINLKGFDNDTVAVIRAVLAGYVEIPKPFIIDEAGLPIVRYRLEPTSKVSSAAPAATPKPVLPDVPDVPGVGFVEDDEYGDLDDVDTL